MKYAVSPAYCSLISALSLPENSFTENQVEIGHGAVEAERVFCSDMTFDATLNPVVYEGGIPVFIDTERDSWNMDPVALEKALRCIRK